MFLQAALPLHCTFSTMTQQSWHHLQENLLHHSEAAADIADKQRTSGGKLLSLLWFSRSTLSPASCLTAAGSTAMPQLLKLRLLKQLQTPGASTHVVQKCPKPSQPRSFQTPDRSVLASSAVTRVSDALPEPLVRVKCMLRSIGGLHTTASRTASDWCGKVAALGIGSKSSRRTTRSCVCCCSSLHACGGTCKGVVGADAVMPV
jgi:hypothetical protein